jgi:hypothetical protein
VSSPRFHTLPATFLPRGPRSHTRPPVSKTSGGPHARSVRATGAAACPLQCRAPGAPLVSAPGPGGRPPLQSRSHLPYSDLPHSDSPYSPLASHQVQPTHPIVTYPTPTYLPYTDLPYSPLASHHVQPTYPIVTYPTATYPIVPRLAPSPAGLPYTDLPYSDLPHSDSP